MLAFIVYSWFDHTVQWVHGMVLGGVVSANRRRSHGSNHIQRDGFQPLPSLPNGLYIAKVNIDVIRPPRSGRLVSKGGIKRILGRKFGHRE
jgi:hypothetical protein